MLTVICIWHLSRLGDELLPGRAVEAMDGISVEIHDGIESIERVLHAASVNETERSSSTRFCRCEDRPAVNPARQTRVSGSCPST